MSGRLLNPSAFSLTPVPGAFGKHRLPMLFRVVKDVMGQVMSHFANGETQA